MLYNKEFVLMDYARLEKQMEFCKEATERANALKQKEKHENSRVFIPAEPAEDTEE